jgi:hypothetical protein
MSRPQNLQVIVLRSVALALLCFVGAFEATRQSASAGPAACIQPPTVAMPVKCRYEFVLAVFVDAERLNDRNAKVEAWIDGTNCTEFSYADAPPNDTPKTGLQYHVFIHGAEEQAGCGEAGRSVQWRANGREANQAFVWPVAARQFPPDYAGYVDVFFGPEPMVLEGNIYRAPAEGFTRSSAVEAFIDGKLCGIGVLSGFSEQFGGGDRYDGLIVRPASVEPGCGRDGVMVSIEIGGIPARNLTVWHPGRLHCCDIALQAPAAPNQPSDARSDKFVWYEYGAGFLTAAVLLAFGVLGWAFRRRA